MEGIGVPVLNTLADVLRSAAGRDSGITYIKSADEETRVSYADLHRRALGMLANLQERGLRPGDEVIIVVNDNEPFVDCFWAALLGGAAAVPLALGNHYEHRRKVFSVFRTLNRPFIVYSRQNRLRLRGFADEQGIRGEFERMKGRSLELEEVSSLGRTGREEPSRPGDCAFIQFSSGSTGDPKGVILTHRNLLHNIASIIKGAAMTGGDRFLNWMPLTHDMGINGFHLVPAALGAEQFQMGTDLFIRRPLLWLQKAAQHACTVLSSPNFGYRYVLDQMDRRGLDPETDLSAVRILFNGAEPISAALCGEFLERMSGHGLPRTAMVPVYGLAEASVAATMPDVTAPVSSRPVARESLVPGVQVVPDESPDAVRLVNVGPAITGSRLRIAGESGEPLAADTVGRILIGGDNVTPGYYTRRGPDPRAHVDGEWLDTGDLGFMHDGDLYVTGRAKDMIIVHGQNLYPHDLEEVAQGISGLSLGRVVVCGARGPAAATDEILVFVHHKGAPEEVAGLAQSIRSGMSRDIGVEIAHVIPVRRIPKTTSGKVRRFELAQAYLAGAFETAIAALGGTGEPGAEPGSDLERTLWEICSQVINRRKVGLDDNIFDLGTNSLDLAQIHERIEEAYPGVLEITDFFDYPTIRGLAAYMQGRLAA